MITSEVAAQTAERVAAAIERQGESRLSISKNTGIPRSTLNSRINGASEFHFTEVVAIARALHVPLYDLLPDAIRVSLKEAA